MRINKILFPTDFSESSKCALFYALHLAEAMKASILLFHAYRVPIPITDVPLEIIEQQARVTENEVRSDLEKVVSESEKYYPKIKIKCLIKQGYVGTYIKEIVKEENIDLIIMHTKGANLFKSLLFGTNAAQILEKVSCPVLVLPDNYNFKPYKHILFTSKYSDTDIESLKQTSEIASLFHSMIHVIKIYNERESKETEFKLTRMFENNVKEKISYHKLNFSCLQGEDVIETIDKYTIQHSTDLLVMSTLRRGALEKLYNRSLTKEMSYHTHIPLLVFHSKMDSDKL